MDSRIRHSGGPGWAPVAICALVTAGILITFLRFTDLTPKVDETFFFSRHDPQLKEEDAILRLFPDSPQVVIAVEGPITSPEFLARLRQLSDAIAGAPGVTGVESLTSGPKNVEDAFKSPLWRRLLLPRDGKSTEVYVSLKSATDRSLVEQLNLIRRRFDRPDFRVMISGVPFITDEIARHLSRDLRVFSMAAVVLFSVLLLIVFSSVWILAGTLTACIDASAASLIASHALHIPIGPLTANLSTMVFVMTLSPIVFLTFNWRHMSADGHTTGETKARATGAVARRAAVRQTIVPSFWSAVCMILGFISLLLVPSTPMRHLGIAGAMGASLAFMSAYLIYPWVLDHASASRRPTAAPETVAPVGFFGRRHGLIVIALVVFTAIAAFGLPRLDTDPTLPSYFKKGGDIRTGLDFIDAEDGSSPLKFVVEDRNDTPLEKGDAYHALQRLQDALDRDPAVGSALSITVVLDEARRPWYTFILTNEKLLEILNSPKHGAITGRLISRDRTKALFYLRMHEASRTTPRRIVIDRLTRIVEQNGFRPVLVGGIYSLLDQEGQLVTSSIISGVLILVGLFVAMGLAFSRSLRVSGAMLVSFAIIPIVVRGYIAFLGMPLDFMTASAANLDLGMGVDAMIYLTLEARRLRDDAADPWTAWARACSRLWQPIATSLIIITSGFGIFLLSTFPPTQRFGLFVIIGSATAATSALILFPYLASPRKARQGRLPVRSEARYSP